MTVETILFVPISMLIVYLPEYYFLLGDHIKFCFIHLKYCLKSKKTETFFFFRPL